MTHFIKFGSLFSRKDLTPSLKSASIAAATISCLSNSSWVSKNVVVDASRSCFVPRLLLSDHEPHFSATSIDLEISSDSGTISSRAPCSRASSELQT